MMEKSAQPGEGGVQAHPLFTITYKIVVYAPAERANMLLLFLLYAYLYSVAAASTLKQLIHIQGLIIVPCLDLLNVRN
jgi:hypothetical protein